MLSSFQIAKALISIMSDMYHSLSPVFLHICRHQPTTATYVPHNKEWLKEKIFGMLKKQAGGRH